MKRRIIRAILAVILIISAVFSLSACGAKDSVTIGSKQFTENILLGEMYAQLIEAKTDIKVERKLNLGGTSVCQPAIKKGEIDIYFEYTGTAYNEILDHELDADTTGEEILATCKEELNKEHELTMFDPIGLNNTFAVAMKSSHMEELGISTLSELADVSDQLVFGANHLFYTRAHDGYDGLVSTYGLNFRDALKMDSSLLYEAAETDDLDVIIVYATDSLLRKYDMTCLEDDKTLFPPYEGAPVCRNEVLKKYPELKTILNSFAGAIDDAAMQELNYQVDIEQKSVEDVAKEFLTQHGYI